jgi:hypothetical protein
MSSIGAQLRFTPSARASAAVIAAMRRSSSGSHEQDCASGIGAPVT